MPQPTYFRWAPEFARNVQATVRPGSAPGNFREGPPSAGFLLLDRKHTENDPHGAHCCGKMAGNARPQLNYEAAVRRISLTANAVAGANLALIVLDVSVLASGLPNVYVSDVAANCGARYLVGYAAHSIVQSGLMAIAAVAISLTYSGWVSVRNLTDTPVGYTGQCFHFAVFLALGALSLSFLLSAGSQLARLGNPPQLPESFQKTHVCPALPYLP